MTQARSVRVGFALHSNGCHVMSYVICHVMSCQLTIYTRRRLIDWFYFPTLTLVSKGNVCCSPQFWLVVRIINHHHGSGSGSGSGFQTKRNQVFPFWVGCYRTPPTNYWWCELSWGAEESNPNEYRDRWPRPVSNLWYLCADWWWWRDVT